MRSFRKFSPADHHIAKKLREFRISLGMSQEKLGQLCGVSFQQIQKYESVQNKISAAKLFEFAQILNKPVNSFFDSIKTQGKHYNYEISSEKKRKKDEIAVNKEILPLIRAFNMIENKQIKKKLVSLIQEIAGPFYNKKSKHQYS
ncbi:MAG TPA: helix-turn-helix transcriptional regulator [Rickettsiales bacterium]|nr:helix-turn-helix transcriptional regulator [Rickettsiales bacterium]